MSPEPMPHRPAGGRAPALLFATACLLLLARPALAQTGTIVCRVVDENGSPRDFVDVNLESEDSASANNFSELTDSDGQVRFSPLPPGNYRLSAFLAGMVSDVIEHIYVKPGDIQNFTIKLVSAGQQEVQVTVTAARLDIVDIKKTETSATLTGEFISTIPLQNKRIQDVVMLFPGVTRSGGSDSSDISIAGGNSSQIGYRLNGANINDPVDGGALLDIPTAAIQDFKLITGGFNAEYGEQSTGIAEIITKSGQNELNFAYDTDYRNSALGAQTLPGLVPVQQLWDDLLNGRGSDGQPSLLAGDLSAGFALLGIPEGISTRDDDNNPTPRQRVRHTVSAGGPIVRDKVFFHQTLEVLRDDFGTPFKDGFVQQDQLLWTSKLNWKLSEKNKLEFNASLDVSDSSGFIFLDATPSIDQNGTSGTWTTTVLDTHVFNPKTFMESRLTISHDYFTNRPADVRTGTGAQYRVPLPPGGVTNYTLGAAGVNSDQSITAIRADWNLSRNQGRHNFKVGAAYGTTTFAAFTDNGPDVTDFRVTDDRNSIFGAVNPLAGRVTSYGPPVRSDDSSAAMSFFLQDKWEVTDSLTLDLGLRGDYQDFVSRLFLAPRFGFSLDPIGDGKTRFHGTWGLFYDNLFANALQWTQNPDRYFDKILFANAFQNERSFGQTPITDIYREALSTPTNSTSADAVSFLLPEFQDRYVLDEDLSAPTNSSWIIGLERRLPADVRFAMNYQEAKRTHQLQSGVITRRIPQSIGEYEVRDNILRSSGEGRYRAWTVEVQKPFSDNWQMNLSYVQSQNTGPIPPPANPLDPRDVVTLNGISGNDRTHVIKLQGSTRLGQKKLKLELASDFIWQTGQPLSARLVSSSGNVSEPFGRNTLRFPSSRQLNLNLRRSFQPADGKFTMTAQVKFFNLLNALNVVSGQGRFVVPPGTLDPESFPPVRVTVLPLTVDVSRSLELGFSFSF